jgi:cytochrome P450
MELGVLISNGGARNRERALEALENRMSDTLEAPLFRPPHPKPRTEPLGMVAFLRAVRENPLNTWMEAHFEDLVLTGEGALGRMTVVNDPAIIRHILVDNAANYRKDDLQIRILAPGLGRGLVTAEGDEWRLQRRTIAPIFTPRHASFRPWSRPPIVSSGAGSAARPAAWSMPPSR